jgi:hypothetical protein
MKAEKPATSISKTAEFKDSVCYRIECDCLSENHHVDTWIEVERTFDDLEDISVTFYVNTYTHPFARGFWQRIKNAAKVLIGVDEQQHEILLKPQAAKNWIQAVENSINNFEKNHERKTD